jgi:hypothetical protein
MGLGIASVADGAVPALGYAWTWAHVDHHLFDAVQQMTHETCNSVADLGTIIKDWDSVSSLTGASDGLVENVKGHMGEWLAADHLQHAGHAIEMPWASNNPAFDLKVDGQVFNLKTTKDAASALRDHFADHPDVPVILPHDAAHIPVDAVHFDPTHGLDIASLHEAGASVVVDDALSNADALQSAHEGLDVGAGDVHLHVPWVTMAVSAFHEGKLLLAGSTEMSRAAKNVAVTTVAVGGAGALGAKGGALIGTFVAPGLGTAIGAAIGGIVGAIAGRKAANAIKRAPLDEARLAYESCQRTFEDVRDKTLFGVQTDWCAAELAVKTSLAEAARTADAVASSAIDSVRAQVANARYLEPGLAARLLDEASTDLRRRSGDLRAEYRKHSVWRRWLWPSHETMVAHSHYVAFRRALGQWEAEGARLLAHAGVAAPEAAAVFDLALAAKNGRKRAREYLVGVGLTRAAAIRRADLAASAALGAVVKARARAVETLRAKRDALLSWAESQMQPAVSALRSARENLVGELKRAGVKVPA